MFPFSTAPTSAIDPSSYSVLGLTHVQYDGRDPLARVLALVTLSPIFLLCAYTTIILYRRELTFVNALLGQLLCEGINWGLKRTIRQGRPTGTYPAAGWSAHAMCCRACDALSWASLCVRCQRA
jgi:hypothetical protein